MARLSGMPSEHHHEGPGDAPRRKRGRPSKSQASSSQAPESSQQEAASQAFKRTASPTAEISQTKRTKRVQVDDDEDQIAQEMQESFSRSQNGNAIGDTIHVETSTTQTTTTRRNGRRHSEPPVAAQDEHDDELFSNPPPSTQPPSGLTPHVNRVGVVRRDMATARRARMSMPAQLHVERVDEEVDGSDGTQFQYAPLTAVLDSRTRRRLRRSHLSQEVNTFEEHQRLDKKELLELRAQLKEQDENIKALEFRLEAARMGNIDMTEDSQAELQQELDQARQEIHDLRASSLYNGSERGMSVFDGAGDMSDVEEEEEEPLMLIEPSQLPEASQRDMDIDFTPSSTYTERVKELSTQMTFSSLPRVSQLTHDTLLEGDETVVPGTINDQAVARYERELQHYIEILAQSQGALRVVTLELQNLHFLDAGKSTDEILTELRHGFDALRTDVEKFFPGTTDELTNRELLLKIPELFSGLFGEVKQKITDVNSLQKTEVLLRRQYEGVLDLLGESEERIQELEQNAFSLDKQNEEKQRTILELDERVMTLTTLTTDQDADVTNKDAQIAGLQRESQDKDTSIQRLREAIDGYRTELDTITVTATIFEKEHHALIAQMEKDHQGAIEALQGDLFAEADAREAAEGEVQQKNEYIEEMEKRIATLGEELTAFTDEAAELSRRLDVQTQGREEAEGQRDEQAVLANDYANKIEDMKDTIDELKAKIAELKDNLEMEREQRESTEAALDAANDEIEVLNQQVRDTGLQANQLRDKLFQTQQEKAAAIAQLEEDAQEREDELNDQLAAQTQGRETAEKTVAKLNKQLEQLEADLETTKIELSDMTEARQLLEQDREQQVTNLNLQLSDLKNKYTALETATNSTITSLQANIIDLNNEVKRQQNDIAALNDEIVAKDALYDRDTNRLTDEIAVLTDDLADSRAENAAKDAEIAKLSQRVEDEAMELLNVTNAHGQESSSLRSAISTHENTILIMQGQAASYKSAIADREREIEGLVADGNARVETITFMRSQIEDLKRKFAQQEEDTRVTVDALNLSLKRLVGENEALGEALKGRNTKILQEVRNMKDVVVETKSVETKSVEVKGGKGKGGVVKGKAKGGKVREVKKSSWRDSGMWGMSSPAKRDAEEDEVPEDFLEA